jgi:NAD(P)-dependent dehydrogenase (short-subunit alcohol dehydrogenase family)
MMQRKFALCVGGTSGIGNALARKFAQHDMNVIVLGRNEAAGNKLVETMQQEHKDGVFEFHKCDAFLMKNIREKCVELKDRLPMLNYCVFTQGIVSMDKRVETVEGIDKKLALHYYGRMQFIEELLPLLRRGAAQAQDAKVVSVLSAGEHQPYLHQSDLSLRINYTLSDVANAAGFYTDLSFDHYSRDLPQNQGVSFLHMHPGNVRTNWGSDLGLVHRILSKLIQAGAMTPEKCADKLSIPLFSEHVARGGFYMVGKTGEPVHTTSAHGPMWRDLVSKHSVEVLESAAAKWPTVAPPTAATAPVVEEGV